LVFLLQISKKGIEKVLDPKKTVLIFIFYFRLYFSKNFVGILSPSVNSKSFNFGM
jgi:hypothetical protein